jgi:putative flippase GtrA
MAGIAEKAIGLWRRSRETRFVVVGVANTAFGYACFAALYFAAHGHVHYLIVQVIAHFISVCNAFIWHRRVTFRSEASWPREFLRFNLSYVGALVFGLVAMPLLVAVAGLQPLIAAALVTIATVGLSYGFHRFYSFSPEP